MLTLKGNTVTREEGYQIPGHGSRLYLSRHTDPGILDLHDGPVYG